MSYCINPKCPHPSKPGEGLQCQHCQTPLVIDNSERPAENNINDHRYRLIKLIKDNPATSTKVFEVEDLDPEDSNKIKILKVIYDDDKQYKGEKLFSLLTKLFEREQNFLYFNENPGIPKGYDNFSLSLCNKKIHCLVMEKIQGCNLEQWLRQNQQPIKEARALDWFKQIVTILSFVHENNFYHRDIKPSNIMWQKSNHQLILIDFGTVKEISGTITNPNGEQMTTEIGTRGYVAPEQLSGKAVPQSDFYALGGTFVFLLTGKHPPEIEPISQWSKQTKFPISESLIALIDDLMQHSPNDRPQNTQIILQRLNDIQNPQRESQTLPPPRFFGSGEFPTLTNPPVAINQQQWSRLIKMAAIVSGAIGIAVLTPLCVRQNTQPPVPPDTESPLSKACNFEIEANISCGEKSLIASDNNQDFPQEKAKGIELFKAGKYLEAESSLKKAWDETVKNKRPDPETLIYWNNSIIRNLLNQEKITVGQVSTIAAAAPLRYIQNQQQIRDQGLEILRGVAQAQKKAIDNKIYLQVVIVNETNDKSQVSQIAEKLGKNKSILGVVGHYSSSMALAALPKYQSNGLVLISPGSTSVKLHAKENFYRTSYSDTENGKEIAKYLQDTLKTRKGAKVTIFWSKDEPFSESFKNAIEKNLAGNEIIKFNQKEEEIFNLNNNQFNAQKALNLAKQQGANAIVLIPDGGISGSLTHAYNVITASKDSDLIIAGADTLYNEDTIDKLEKSLSTNNFVVPVPWHPLNNKNFSKKAEEVWGTTNVSWLTATAYDATLALTEAVKQNPTRKGVKDILSKSDFRVQGGATGEIRFDKSERLNPKVTLVKLLPNCQSASGYRFFPVLEPNNCVP
jgi:ABC-type branched-subunit amino acid transport system substrate-binding protein/serine/threonine protein kinase